MSAKAAPKQKAPSKPGRPCSVEDPRTWDAIYPVYFDVKKSCAEGRRVPQNQAVENPRVEDIDEVCKFFRLPTVIERDAKYPRDFQSLGRVRVCLENNGQPLQPEIPNKKALLKKLAEFIPRLQSRVKAQQTSTTTTTTSASGKKGRRGKK